MVVYIGWRKSPVTKTTLGWVGRDTLLNNHHTDVLQPKVDKAESKMVEF